MMDKTEEQSTQEGRPEIDAIFGIAQIHLSIAEQVWMTNMSVIRGCFADSTQYARALAGANHSGNLYQSGAALFPEAIDRTFSYQRDICAAAFHARGELARVAERQTWDVNRTLTATFDRLARYLPGGVDISAALFRAAFETASNMLYHFTGDWVEIIKAADPPGPAALPAADSGIPGPRKPRQRAA